MHEQKISSRDQLIEQIIDRDTDHSDLAEREALRKHLQTKTWDELMRIWDRATGH